jgi:hypothetical protein
MVEMMACNDESGSLGSWYAEATALIGEVINAEKYNG